VTLNLTRAQGIPEYKIGLGGGKEGRLEFCGPALAIVAAYPFWRWVEMLGRSSFFSLILWSLSISFTRGQGIPKYKIQDRVGRGKGWESWGKIG
jgi:hypothetical protein